MIEIRKKKGSLDVAGNLEETHVRSTRDESADRVIRCRTELYLLYGTFMAPIKIRSALPVGHYEPEDEDISSDR